MRGVFAHFLELNSGPSRRFPLLGKPAWRHGRALACTHSTPRRRSRQCTKWRSSGAPRTRADRSAWEALEHSDGRLAVPSLHQRPVAGAPPGRAHARGDRATACGGTGQHATPAGARPMARADPRLKATVLAERRSPSANVATALDEAAVAGLRDATLATARRVRRPAQPLGRAIAPRGRGWRWPMRAVAVASTRAACCGAAGRGTRATVLLTPARRAKLCPLPTSPPPAVASTPSGGCAAERRRALEAAAAAAAAAAAPPPPGLTTMWRLAEAAACPLGLGRPEELALPAEAAAAARSGRTVFGVVRVRDAGAAAATRTHPLHAAAAAGQEHLGHVRAGAQPLPVVHGHACGRRRLRDAGLPSPVYM